IERCLAKEPRERYASTEDLARELKTLRDHLSQRLEPAGAPGRPRAAARWAWIAGIAVLAVVALLAVRTRPSPAVSSSFRQLTFGPAGLGMARFAPDGKTVVYSADRANQKRGVYLTRIDSPESRLLFPDADLYSISRFDEIALMPGGWLRRPNLLSRVPLA